MYFDVLLPSVLFIIIVLSIFLQRRLEKRMTILVEEARISLWEAFLIVAFMGVAVTAIVFIPEMAVQIIFLTAYSYVLFFFVYVAYKRWYLAIIPPIIFVYSYLNYWNLIVSNIFAVIFCIIITVYASGLFSWRTVWIFAILLTVMDVIQVFFTGFMGQSAVKMMRLKLPVMLLLPTYPHGLPIGLGLGDIFLASLLSIQMASKYGVKAGILTAATNSLAMFIFEVALLNIMFARFFPATLVVIAGSALGLWTTCMMRRQ